MSAFTIGEDQMRPIVDFVVQGSLGSQVRYVRTSNHLLISCASVSLFSIVFKKVVTSTMHASTYRLKVTSPLNKRSSYYSPPPPKSRNSVGNLLVGPEHQA